jgi:hypothetical protein
MNPSTHEHELLTLLARYTGLQWSFADADKKVLGVPGRWQLMLENPADDMHPFWYWHLDHANQWFDSKNAAALNLLKSWVNFIDANQRGTMATPMHAGAS